MSFPSLRGGSQHEANLAGHSKIVVRVQVWLVLALFLTVASRMSHAQVRLTAAAHSAEVQLEDGRTTLDEHTLMAA